MGIIHSSSSRFLGRETEDEEGDSSISSKIFTFHSLFCKVLKGLSQKLRPISKHLSWPRGKLTADDPILPIQNPAAAPIFSISSDNLPLLVQPLLVSEYSSGEKSKPPTSKLSTPLADLSNTNIIIDIQEFRSSCHDDHIVDDVSTDHDEAIASIPDSTYSLACASSASADPQNVPFLEEKVLIKSSNVAVGEGIRWIKHYNSRHRILLVGDGDFSFSACLALAFGSAPNMIPTSLDSKAFLKKNYQNASLNIMELRRRECKVMHGIDATKMANHELLGHLKFDRIIYNFPFAGFFKNLSRESQLRRHRRLVSLFLKNAREMISEDGEIHISHKTNEFHVEWKLESVASSHRLRLIEAVEFNHMDYPGYNTKCGFGGDNNFNCNPSKTYKFGLRY